MNKYSVVVSLGAEKDLDRISLNYRNRILKKLISLQDNPRPPGVKKLKGIENRWRIRVGDYRVVYEIVDDRLVVLIVQVAHRREIYE